MDKEKIEIEIKIQNSKLSISIVYYKTLTLEDIQMGFWLYQEPGDSQFELEQIMAPFIKIDKWHLLEEAISYWVNDDFDESFPFSLIRNLNEYRPDILNDSLNETTIYLSINRIAD